MDRHTELDLQLLTEGIGRIVKPPSLDFMLDVFAIGWLLSEIIGC